jgi:hypothetical protein
LREAETSVPDDASLRSAEPNTGENRQYLSALSVECSLEQIEEPGELSARLPSDTAVEYYPKWGAKKVYVCPRGIYCHRGQPERCGAKCMKAQGDADAVYIEELALRVLVVRKRIVLDMHACMHGG